jgi:hypothetical protein
MYGIVQNGEAVPRQPRACLGGKSWVATAWLSGDAGMDVARRRRGGAWVLALALLTLALSLLCTAEGSTFLGN